MIEKPLYFASLSDTDMHFVCDRIEQKSLTQVLEMGLWKCVLGFTKWSEREDGNWLVLFRFNSELIADLFFN